jgi:uncharacterized membrane protein
MTQETTQAPGSASAPARVRGVRRGLVHLTISVIAGLVTGWLVPDHGVSGVAALAAGRVGSMVFAALGWVHIMTSDAEGTRRRAAAEDPGRTLVWIVVIAASAFSLFAALLVLRNARHSSSSAREMLVGLCVVAVAMSWLLTHTSYALRYAHLFYRDDEEGTGGLDFPGQSPPSYFDFAYFAFTVGMCFQVSDVAVSSPQIRRVVLAHAVLSFVYNTTILALALNLVFGLFN